MKHTLFKTVMATLLFLCFLFTGITFAQAPPVINGEMKVWYPVTITFEGPWADETEATFTDYRLDVTFAKGSKTYVVPGYFAADGDAANTSASSGNKWRVKFTPDEAGTWSYSVSFLTGNDIAKDVTPVGGTAGTYPDNESGVFNIAPADPNAPGFYAKGMLRYVGEHFLQFQGSEEWFVKAGPGSPENFFGYADFDGTQDEGGSVDDSNLGPDGLHNYNAHIDDWETGDPEWQGGKGHGIIGALNHLSNEGANTLYHIIMTVDADTNDT